MKNLILLSLVCLVGCTHLHTKIEETDKDGSKRTTENSCTSFFDSKSELAKFKTTNTEKTQSMGIGALSQESSGTNAVNVLNNVARIVEAAAKIP